MEFEGVRAASKENGEEEDRGGEGYYRVGDFQGVLPVSSIF